VEETAPQLSTRAKHLLLTLLHERGPVVIADLARRFGVSPRSIRYDLDEIGAWLETTPVTLRRRPRVGIWIEGDESAFELTRERLGLVEEYRPVLSPEQRRNIIVARLLESDVPVTSHALADELHVSRTTVFSDLDDVQDWLEQRGPSLVRRSNYGLRVIGEESAWRQAVSDLLNEFAESGELGRLIMQTRCGDDEGGDSEWFGGAPQLMALLQGLDLGKIEAVVRWAEATAGVEFTTGSYSALVFQIAIAVQRLSQGKQVKMTADRLAALQSHGEYSLALMVAARIAEEFSVDVPEPEVGNLALHFIGAKVRGPSKDRTDEAERICPLLDVEASAVAGQLVTAAERALGFPLADDGSLVSNLALHLHPAFGRIRFGLPATNPHLPGIKESYPRILAAAGEACRAVERLAGLEMPPEEEGHVALHLIAAVLRKVRKGRAKRRVVVASTGGIGVNEILEARLAAEFCDLEIAALCSAHTLTEVADAVAPDFIVSTSPVPGLGLEVIVVDPLLPHEDVERIRFFLDHSYRLDEEELLAQAARD